MQFSIVKIPGNFSGILFYKFHHHEGLDYLCKNQNIYEIFY